MASHRTSFRQRVLLGLLGYTVLLTVAVAIHGLVFNERAEHLVWETLLNTELDYIVARAHDDPGFQWTPGEGTVFYDGSELQAIPAGFRALGPGVHDEIKLDGVQYVVLVREVDGRLLVLAQDIVELEQSEFDTGLTVLWSALGLLVVLGLGIAWGTDRLVRPLTSMAARISRLQPDQPGQRVEVPDAANSELVVIAEALNDYLQRNDRFVERERVFIDTASHELRTPIAVIAGASEIALQQHDVPAMTRAQLTRIRRTAREVEQLISLLLVLAKDPARLSKVNDTVALDELLQEIVEDHRHLTRDKDLALTLAPMQHSEIIAPLPIVQAAIGNLLRNAIENSDRGEIIVSLRAPATVVIDDPGHGMTPEEISAIYARVAKGGGDRDGSGIGLDLISRLCEHLGWRLHLQSDGARGTTTVLTFNT